jgi:fructokinase
VVHDLERRIGGIRSDREPPTVGIGIPGTIVPSTGLVKNANSTWLNGRPLERDLAAALGRPVRCANDANCLAVSEATDGAAAGAGLVFAVILGTGCGGGIAVDGRVHIGPNGVAGEWGHNPLPWPTPDELPGPQCFCGQHGCLETWISGTGLAQDHQRVTGYALTGPEIVAAADAGDAAARASLARLEDRIGRALASVVNLLDPDVIVIGGGLSKLDRLYVNLPPLIEEHLFGGGMLTPVRRAKHGDASGVRGAAWLWPA